MHCLLLAISVVVVVCGCKKNDSNPIYTLPTSTPTPATITDIDGNVYHTVAIGTQVWLRENLKTTRYRNGDPIPTVTDNAAWSNLTTGAYCYNMNDTNKLKIYGCLYNWFAVVDARKICPTGWHVPTDFERHILSNYLGTDNTGGKLKETGLTHWDFPNDGATNETGFTALPGGCRDNYGSFLGIGSTGDWWTSTENSFNGGAMNYSLSCLLGYFPFGSSEKTSGYSVRCIKD